MAHHQQVVLRDAAPRSVTSAVRRCRIAPRAPHWASRRAARFARPFPLAAALLATTWVAACERELTPPTVRRERLPSGVERVVNRPDPTDSALLPWRWVEELTLSPPDTGVGALMQPSHAVRTRSGLVVVADVNPRAIKVFDRAGRLVRTLGREGSGPGEYRYVQLGIDVDTVVVFDPTQHRLMRFSLDGTLLRTATVSSNFFGPALDVSADGEVFVWSSAGVVRVRRAGARHDTLPRPPEWRGAKAWWEFALPAGVDGDARVVREPIPFLPAREMAIRVDGLLVHGVTDRYELIVSSNGLDSLRVISSVAPAVEIADTTRQRAYERARAGHGVRAFVAPMSRVVQLSDIPRMRPLWSALHADSWCRIWVSLPTASHERGRWEVFDSSGAFLGRVASMQSPLPRGAWSNERYLVIDEDAGGRPVVRVWRLDETPPTGTASTPSHPPVAPAAAVARSAAAPR